MAQCEKLVFHHNHHTQKMNASSCACPEDFDIFFCFKVTFMIMFHSVNNIAAFAKLDVSLIVSHGETIVTLPGSLHNHCK